METRAVTLNGCKLDGEIKEDKDGKYYCLVKNMMTSKKLESIFYLEFSKVQYKILSKIDYKNELIKIIGTMQVRKNKKDIPFLYFKCHNLCKEKEDKIPSLETTPKKPEKFPKKGVVNWRVLVPNINENSKFIDSDKIELIEDVHKKGSMFFNLDEFNENYPIAVKPIADKEGYYSLVSGFRHVVVAKILNKPVNAYITNYNYDEFHELYVNKKVEDLKEKLEELKLEELK